MVGRDFHDDSQALVPSARKCSTRMLILMLAGFAGVGVAAPAGGEMPGRAVRQIRRFSPLPARAAFGRPSCLDGREAPVAAFAKSRRGRIPAPI